MPFLILLLIFVSTSYQLFFRYEHWNDRNEPQLVYERDNLTGETHIIHPGDQISLVQRITGKFPPQNYVKDPSHIPQHQRDQHTIAQIQTRQSRHSSSQSHQLPIQKRTSAPVPLEELSLPPEPVNALAREATTSAPNLHPSHQASPVPPEPTEALSLAAVSHHPQDTKEQAHHLQQPAHHKPTATQTAPYQQEKKVDLNRDGQPEKVTLHRAQDGLLDIAILQGQQEVFYGRGESLQILSHRNHGWSDIALVIPGETNQIFGYNPTKQAYQVNHSR